MAKKPARSRTAPENAARETAATDELWVRRNAVTGRFLQSKKTGGAFKGVRRES
jgi:hypothetical protein